MKTLEDVLEEITPQPDPEFAADMERRMQRLASERPPDAAPPGEPVDIPSSRHRSRGRQRDAGRAREPVALERRRRGCDEPGPADRPGGAEHDVERLRGRRRWRATPWPAPRSCRHPPIPPADGRVAPGAQTRRVERSAQLTLADDPSEFDRLADAIFRTADRHRGFVLRSSFTQGEAGPSSGFFELRVPSDELQPALNALSRLATVRARSESGTDVTPRSYRSATASGPRRPSARACFAGSSRPRRTRPPRPSGRRLEIVGNKITALRQQFLARGSGPSSPRSTWSSSTRTTA